MAPGRPDGLVEELVQQFADPLAFYRELVQNSIDAGARAIAVTLAWEPGPEEAGALTVAVRDDGSGMGRDVLENQLMVLFRSGKEGRENAIGRFGVGFVSVLALQPTLVAVQSSEGRGEQWTLHVHPDYSYDLFRAAGEGARGTTVTLHLRLGRAELERFVQGSQRALLDWCAHVEVPVRFVAYEVGAAAPLAETRIDRPFGLEDVLVAAEASSDDGQTRVVAGLPRDGCSSIAFYKRGLLLHRSSADALGAVSLKILDARLEHTISRDDVRRDAHLERALRFARSVVEGPLTTRARERLDAVAEGRSSEPRLDRWLAAVEAARLPVDLRAVRLPLLYPLEGERALSGRVLERRAVHVARAPSALGEAATASGMPVLDLSVAEHQADYLALLGRALGRVPPLLDAELTLATPIEEEPADHALLEVASRILGEAARVPMAPRLVQLGGARSSALTVAGVEALPAVLTREQATRDPFRLLRRPPLWINVRSSLVVAVRRAAAQDPSFAGALLARAILLDQRALDTAADDAWLAASLREVS